jgi:hypothetical protein
MDALGGPGAALIVGLDNSRRSSAIVRYLKD